MGGLPAVRVCGLVVACTPPKEPRRQLLVDMKLRLSQTETSHVFVEENEIVNEVETPTAVFESLRGRLFGLA